MDRQLHHHRVINSRRTADEKETLLIVGLFQRLAHRNRNLGQRLDRLQHHAGSAVRIFRIADHIGQAIVRQRRQFCIIPDHAPNAAGCQDMLAIEHGVVEQMAAASLPNQKALDHGYLPQSYWLCEGDDSARMMAELIRQNGME